MRIEGVRKTKYFVQVFELVTRCTQRICSSLDVLLAAGELGFIIAAGDQDIWENIDLSISCFCGTKHTFPQLINKNTNVPSTVHSERALQSL